MKTIYENFVIVQKYLNNFLKNQTFKNIKTCLSYYHALKRATFEAHDFDFIS